jgi:hypothetical protein
MRRAQVGLWEEARARRNRKFHTLELGSGSKGLMLIDQTHSLSRDLHHIFHGFLSSLGHRLATAQHGNLG